MSLNESDAYIALNALTGIGVNNFHGLLGKFGSAAAVFRAGASALEEADGIGPKTSGQIASCNPQKTADAERKKAEKFRADIVTSLDGRYPRNLKTLHRSPPVLYVAGEIRETDAISVAIVGTRNPTPYGRISAENLAAVLGKRGLAIVSGFARGIDGFAHRTALETGGRTIAVLGSGLDVCYPPEHRDLFEKVRERGAVVSQFRFGTEPDKRNFPIRNRLICGLALGVVVVEAGEKSGAAITAYAALEEGREVFAVPGRIDSSKSVGTNRLIQKGAKLVTNAEEVIEEFPPEVRALLEDVPAPGSALFSPDETKILALLEEDEKHIDFIIENTGLPSSVVLGTLLEMELSGSVRQLPGNIFAKAR